MVLKIICKFG